VIFPFSDIERHGIEDLRLVRFTDDDGRHTYYGTFTAFDGGRAFPKMLEYPGGDTININLITGECAKNKGMALFPRRIRGKYAMISRIDNENLYYMESDDILAWETAQLIQEPKYAWQVIQIGNCGSPIETDRGWLLLTHGVGPMREYCIGATLLEKDEPWRVIGQSREPLLLPNADERSGYVPNVVYSCGAMVHNNILIIPYAMSDITSSIARIDLDALLGSLEPS
jgi:beta-1,2-mannobiose phosphorylase / 1,2-beta-oligomannan phosphorylase